MTISDQDVLLDISRKLSVLIHLELDKDESSRIDDQVVRLSRFGLNTPAIAEILGTTTGTVAVAKSRMKKKRKG